MYKLLKIIQIAFLQEKIPYCTFIVNNKRYQIGSIRRLNEETVCCFYWDAGFKNQIIFNMSHIEAVCGLPDYIYESIENTTLTAFT